MTPRVRLLAALAALAVGLAGCGSHTVTRAQVIARADGICAGTLRLVRISQAAGVDVTRVVPLIAREVHQLNQLPRPAEEHGLLTRYLRAMATELAQWRALANTQGSPASSSDVRAGGSESRTAALRRLSADPAPALAGRYGMRDCAAAGATSGSGGRASSSG